MIDLDILENYYPRNNHNFCIEYNATTWYYDMDYLKE